MSLSSDGKTLAVGSPYNDGNGTSAGHTRVYVWDGSDWVQRGDDLDGEGAGDEFGKSVSLTGDGKTLAVGGPDNTNQGYTRGHVRLYRWDGSAWVRLGNDLDGESGSAGEFGFATALSRDGSTLAVGDWNHTICMYMICRARILTKMALRIPSMPSR